MSSSLAFVENKATFSLLQMEFNHHSARAKCTTHGDILQIGYTGPITLQSIDILESKVLPMRKNASAVLERMDTAMLTWAGPIVVSQDNYPIWSPPSAVIVPDDQYERTIEFCSLLARLGVLRMAFRPSQSELAREWVDCFRA